MSKVSVTLTIFLISIGAIIFLFYKKRKIESTTLDALYKIAIIVGTLTAIATLILSIQLSDHRKETEDKIEDVLEPISQPLQTTTSVESISKPTQHPLPSVSETYIAKTKAIEEPLGKGIEEGTIITPISETTSMSPGESNVLVKAEVNDFTFEARECKKSRQEVLCSISVTNNLSKERTLKIIDDFNQSPYFIDDSGNKIEKKNRYFGISPPTVGTYGGISEEIFPNLPVNLNLVSKNISTTPTSISVVIYCEEFDRSQESWGVNYISKGKFQVVLRDIPLTK